MRNRTTAAALAIVCLALAGTAACSSKPSQAEIAKRCQAALHAQDENGEKGKPKDCDGLSEDDYTALVTQNAVNDLGWTDGSGSFDPSKMIQDTTSNP